MTNTSFNLQNGIFLPFSPEATGVGIPGQFTTWSTDNAIGPAGTPSGSLLDQLTGFSSTGILQRTGAGAYSFLGVNAASGLLQLDSNGGFPAVNIVGAGLTGHAPGTRAPLFVWSNPSTSSAGQTGCAQFWMGNNPTGTPASSDFITLTAVAINGNSRSFLWGSNTVVQQGNFGSGWVDGPIVGEEIDLVTGWQACTNSFNNATNFKKIGLELFNTGSAASNFNATSGVAIWSPDTTGACWWYEGIALSRVLNNGIVFYKDPGGTDGVAAFSSAAILDQSASATSYKVTGTHTAGVDLSGGTFSGNAFASPGFSVKGDGSEANVGGATNAIGLAGSISVNASSGNSGFQLLTGSSSRGYLAATSSLVQLLTNGSLPLLLGVNNAATLTLGTDKSATFAGKLKTLASATGAAGVSIPSGTAPTSPVDGDMWYDGTNLKFRVGATTKTVTLT